MARLHELALGTRIVAENNNYLVGETGNLSDTIKTTVEAEPRNILGIEATAKVFNRIYDTGIFLLTAQELGIPKEILPIFSLLQAGDDANHFLVMYQLNTEVKQSFGQPPRWRSAKELFARADAPKEKPEYVGYVFCIGKQPVNPKETGKTQRDFAELKEVYDSFPQGIKYEETVLRTIRPLVNGKVKLDGKSYTIYTTLFDSNPEIGCRGKIVNGKDRQGNPDPRVLPYLLHPTINNEWEEGTNMIIEKRIDQLTYQTRFEADNYKSKIKRNFERILFGNALVAVSTGKFPRDFLLNRGDWLGNYDTSGDNINRLTFISTNGSLQPTDEDKWVAQMLQHEETFPQYSTLGDPLLIISPFSSQEIGFTEKQLHTIYQKAREATH